MAISDSARDFWDRISPRERALVILAGIAMPITIAVWLGLAISDGLGSMERRNEDTRKALDIVEELHARGPASTTEPDIVLPKEPMLLETYLNNAATTAGFTLKGTTPRPTPLPKNGIVTTSVSFTLEQLDIDKLKAFLQEIETKSKIVVVTHLDLKRSFKDKKKIDAATVEVSTYSKPDAAADKKDEKSGSGSGSGDKKGG